MLNYSLLFFSIIAIIDDIVFFNSVIKPLPLISHCLFSVLCLHGARDIIAFHFQHTARTERRKALVKESTPSALRIVHNKASLEGITFPSNSADLVRDVCQGSTT